MLVVAMCTALFLGLTALRLFHLVGWQQALYVLGLSREGILQRLWLFQLLTAPLLHANLTHLAFNMLTLWMLGPDVEAVLGRRRYIIFCLLCAQSALATFLLCNPGSRVITCGYSAVIFGILVAQAVFFPNRTLYIYAFFPLKMKHAVLILGAVEAYLAVFPSGTGVGHFSHLLGAIGALVYLQCARRCAPTPRAAQESRDATARCAPAWKPRGDASTPQHRARAGESPRGQARAAARAVGPSITGPECGRRAAQEPLQDIEPATPVNGSRAAERGPFLVVLTGPLAGCCFHLSNRPLTLGRVAGNHIVLAGDRRVSRVHAEIVLDAADCYVITDKNSRNGTFVNGKRTHRHVLQPGDRVRIGATEIAFAPPEAKPADR
jgi:membrane associated rhomboid family serine protease